jgi:hypothetical protein
MDSIGAGKKQTIDSIDSIFIIYVLGDSTMNSIDTMPYYR